MKKYLLTVLLVIFAFVARAQNDGDIIKVGDQMPAFTIVSDDGKQISSASLKGKVVLINFFATWCPPCQKELAEVQQKLWPKFKDNKNFQMLVIGREHTDAELAKYNEKKGFTFPLYPDKNRAIFGAFAKNLIPRTYLIGKDGKVMYAGKGYTEEEFAGLMDKIGASLKELLSMGGNELVIVAVPVYGGRVAETAMDRIRMFKGNATPVIPVVVYGNRDYEDALKELSDALSAQGFVPVSAGAFIGEHSYSRKDMPIAAGRPDKDDLLKASEFGSEILKKLDNVSTLTDLQPLEVKGNFPYKVKGPSTPQAPVTDEDLCTQCEYCIDVCPVAAISIVDDRMFSDPSLCIKCCACVKECPEGARTFDTPYTAMLHKNFSARREPELFI